MKRVTCVSICLLSLAWLVAGTPVDAETPAHTITVAVDDSTADDIELIGAFLATAPAGAEVSRTLRRIVMGAVGEVVLAANRRIDANDLLTLDDGSVVPLSEDDAIHIKVIDAKLVRKFGPVFECLKKPGAARSCQPVAVVLPSGERLDIPPILKKK